MIKLLKTLMCSSILFIISCNNKKKLEEQKTANEIIAECIKSTIGIGDSARIAFKSFLNIPAYIPKGEEEERRRKDDSIKKVMNAIDPFIVVSDSIFTIAEDLEYDFKGLLDETIKNGFDTTGYLALNKIYSLQPDTSYISQQIGVKVTTKGPWEKGRELYYHNPRFIAIFNYYNISYSDEKKKAFVYGVVGIERGSSSVNLYFLDKINDKWKVVYKRTVW